MQREGNKSNTSATQVRHERGTGGKSATRVLHERTSGKRVKIFDFDDDTGENIFSHPCIYYMASEDYKERGNFIARTTSWKCRVPCQNAFEKCTTKNELCNGKSYIRKLNTRL